jgi:hypothetical protein
VRYARSLYDISLNRFMRLANPYLFTLEPVLQTFGISLSRPVPVQKIIEH